MKKILFAVMIAFIFCSNAIAADDGAPWPTTDNSGVFVSQKTFNMGKCDPSQPLYLLSDDHGWRPNEKNMMKKASGGYKSELVLSSGSGFHPAQVINGKVEYLKIQFAHPNWQLEKDHVKDPITYKVP